MAKPNYQYEKRQKDLAKQRKKQEKEQEKAARKANKGPEVTAEGGEASAVAAPSDETDQKSGE
jgi:preprotein translocase subunit YajC